MHALFVQLGLIEELEGESKHGTPMTEKDKKILLEKAHNAIILNLGDKVLRRVSKKKTTTRLWMKLESLYVTKSLVNCMYLKHALYSYKMSSEKGISEHLNEFDP